MQAPPITSNHPNQFVPCRRPERRDNTHLTTPFGADSTAAEVISGVELTAKRGVITGASSGISLQTALALAGAGAQVSLAVRDLQAGSLAAEQIRHATGRDDVHLAHVDLSDRSTIDAFVASCTGSRDILLNNAGIMAPRTHPHPGGLVSQFVTNQLLDDVIGHGA